MAELTDEEVAELRLMLQKRRIADETMLIRERMVWLFRLVNAWFLFENTDQVMKSIDLSLSQNRSWFTVDDSRCGRFELGVPIPERNREMTIWEINWYPSGGQVIRWHSDSELRTVVKKQLSAPFEFYRAMEKIRDDENAIRRAGRRFE